MNYNKQILIEAAKLLYKDYLEFRNNDEFDVNFFNNILEIFIKFKY